MTPPPRPLVTVGALLVSPSGRVLLIHTYKWRGLWGVPGGKIDYGETLAAAIEREVHEETGLSIGEICWAPVQEAINSREFYKPSHMILLNFVARCHSEAVVLNEEAGAFAWLTVSEALGYPLNTPTRHLIRYYQQHSFSGEPLACRPH
jgi:ADP-ribose pyrophosphatase YjhB (NUDIX family)